MADDPDKSELTPEQRRAIETRQVSVALSAGAGCGKTFVLTRRFLTHLEGLDPDRLGRFVAITFTDRAAREMRDRIRRACHDRVVKAADDQAAERWLKLYRELESARISTIHSFCGSLLRSHAVEAGLDPSFQTLDESQAATLRAGYLDERLRELLANRDATTLDLAVRFGLEGLRDLISHALAKRQTIDFALWSDTSPDELLTRWGTFHREHVRPELVRRLLQGDCLRDLTHFLRENEPAHPLMKERRAAILEAAPRLEDNSDLAARLGLIRESAKSDRIGRANPWATDHAKEIYQSLCSNLRKEISDVLEQLDFDPEAARPAAETVPKLVALVQPIAAGYDARKRELNCLDFEDLLVRSQRLLEDERNAGLRKRLAEQIDLLLVDESQDTDPVQIGLIRALCGDDVGDGKLFFVGDYKQSIYRFRGADPGVFRALRESIPAPGRLPLTLNFRSQPAILHFVNALFCDALGSDYEPLRAHRPQVTPSPAIEFLWAVPELADGEKANVALCRRLEARWIARRLKQMIVSREPIVCESPKAGGSTHHARPVHPGDIAILFRALSDVAMYEEALREQGIDYYLVGGRAFYAQQEVFDLLNLLRSLASPCDDVSLVGVLRSPFFSLSDEALYWLAQHEGGLAAGLFATELSAELDSEQGRRVIHAAETLRWLRARKDRVPIADLINDALTRTGYDAILVAEFMGPRKLANLRKLIDQARSFDQSGLFTLADFIAQLAEFVADQPHEPLAATHPEKTDVVRLMSIHQSKGLEFPVVVVPDLDRKPPGSRSSVAFHPKLGPLIRLPGEDGQAFAGIQMLKSIEEEEEHAERLRLLYVATTRAADYLLLSAGMEKLESQRNPWRKLLADRFDLKTGECTAELPPGYETPRVKVTTTEPFNAETTEAKSRRRPLNEIAAAARSRIDKGSTEPPPFVAPVRADSMARRQFSFSRLNEGVEPTPTEPAPIDVFPAPLSPPRSIDPLRLGKLVHDALAVIPLDATVNLRELIQRQAARGGDATDDEVAETVDMVERFAESTLFRRLAAASEVHREIEFLLTWPPDASASEAMRLHGVIDCLHRDAAGAWHLLDYKTNHVTPKTLASVAEPYRLQMALYALALERTLGQLPASMELYFLRLGLSFSIEFEPEAWQSAIEQINRSIARLRDECVTVASIAATTVKPGKSNGGKRRAFTKPD
jgi:ATP-dependent helicase/nuclease subunit A